MTIELQSEVRNDLGKGASRRLRRENKVPAIIYGAGKEPVNVSLLQNEIQKQLENEAFFSQIISLKVDKKAEKVVLRDIQHHPFKQDVLHMDFQRIDAKHKMHVHIPLHFIGEDVAPGVKQGGKVSHVMVEVDVECLPKDIPEFIEVDVSALNVGDSIHLSELNLPKGVELMLLKQGADHDTAVVAIHAVRGGAAEEEEEASSAEGEAEGKAE